MPKDRPAYKPQAAPRQVSTGTKSNPVSPTKGKPRFEANPTTRRTKAPL